MSTGSPYPYPSLSDFRSGPSDADVRVAELEAEIRGMKTASQRALEHAYEEGLGAAAEVYRQNKVLAATIAALMDRTSELRIKA